MIDSPVYSPFSEPRQAAITAWQDDPTREPLRCETDGAVLTVGPHLTCPDCGATRYWVPVECAGLPNVSTDKRRSAVARLRRAHEVAARAVAERDILRAQLAALQGQMGPKAPLLFDPIGSLVSAFEFAREYSGKDIRPSSTFFALLASHLITQGALRPPLTAAEVRS